ncbi:50S ribosomal protein L11 methyltransferase [Desulfosoma caldarium]|uniref:50S ribosomal protein L11 methyltransferase n=1 Tax=Desulfosoma caldarium TaxID=610254 RepID=UPI0014738C86|nr:50S ribosomal protein L11 methyltransferase [Desulfosoma caldarium]
MLECLVKPGCEGGGVSGEGLVGCWREPPYVYCFYDRKVTQLVVAHLASKGFHVTGRYEINYDQWQRLPPQCVTVGPFRILCASPFDNELSAHSLDIIVQPGLVFGSGMHPTTQLCLNLLARVFAPESMKTVVDVGTGTGILALAAARLGAQRVLALDVNPLATQEAAANVRKNRLEHQVLVVTANSLDAIGNFGELLLLNLEWPNLRAVLRTDGWKRFPWVICSGYLQSQTQPLECVFLETHTLHSHAVQEDWAASFWTRSPSCP